jgi:hypothetical protein
MAYVYQAGVFTSIAINIGLADKQLQDELALVAGTALSYTKTARNYVTTSFDSSSTDSNTDATTILTQAFRNTENSLTSTLSPFYSSTLVSLNNYFTTIVGSSFRDYFNSKSAATTIDFSSSATGYSSFRDVYRRTYSNELLYFICSIFFYSWDFWLCWIFIGNSKVWKFSYWRNNYIISYQNNR